MSSRGFSLLEVIMYLALFSIIMSNALIATYNLIDSAKDNLQFEALYTESLFITKKIAWMLANADEVTVKSTSTVTVTQSGTEEPKIIYVGSTSSRLWIQYNDDEMQMLSGPEFTISDVMFRIDGTPPKFEMTYLINTIPFRYSQYIGK